MSVETDARLDRVGPWRSEHGAGGADGAARWLPIGTRSSGVLAIVDPAGLVGPPGVGWSLDWWVGAEDRWYVPARETAVRQATVDASPVVETRQRVPGGDIVHRVHAAQGSADLGGREVVIVELTNETPVPVAVAVAIRPYGVEGDGAIHRLDPGDGGSVGIDGRWTLVPDRPPRRWATGTDGPDPLHVVTTGAASETCEAVDDLVGRASVALVFPLPHTATIRVALVAGDPPRTPSTAVTALPGPAVVASGWARQADHGLRLGVPDEKLEAAFTTARRRLLLEAPDLVDAPVGTEQAFRALSLAALGHQDDLRPVIGSLLDRQRLTGAIPDGTGSEASTGAALTVIGGWWRHAPRPELLDELVGPVAKAAHYIERRRGRRHRRDPSRAGLLPPGPQPVELGGPTTAYLDDWWSAAGLLEAAALLGAAGQTGPSVDAARDAHALLDDVRRSVGAVGPGLTDGAVPAGPDRELDAGIVGLLPALAPLGVVGSDEQVVARTLEVIRSELVAADRSVGSGAAGGTASPWLTACLALHELARHDSRAIDRLAWLVRAGGPTAGWPRRLDQRGMGHGGCGDDPAAAALFTLLVRRLLLVERRTPAAVVADGLEILPVVPPAWLGAGIELHDAPTTFGRFGFAVRWHGERPALLWELEAAPDAPTPTITAPGLAPGWSTAEPVGEALLPAPSTAPSHRTTSIPTDGG